MNEFYLSLGSNCGDRRQAICQAVERLRERVSVVQVSELYETPDAHGGPKRYLNAVAHVRTEASAEEMERICKNLELKAGRDEAARRRGDVPIDIDPVIFNGQIIRPRDYQALFFQTGYRFFE